MEVAGAPMGGLGDSWGLGARLPLGLPSWPRTYRLGWVAPAATTCSGQTGLTGSRPGPWSRWRAGRLPSDHGEGDDRARHGELAGLGGHAADRAEDAAEHALDLDDEPGRLQLLGRGAHLASDEVGQLDRLRPERDGDRDVVAPVELDVVAG